MNCVLCNKQLEENDLFWIIEIERISDLLESKREIVKVCCDHVDYGVNYINRKSKEDDEKLRYLTNSAWT